MAQTTNLHDEQLVDAHRCLRVHHVGLGAQEGHDARESCQRVGLGDLGPKCDGELQRISTQDLRLQGTSTGSAEHLRLICRL